MIITRLSSRQALQTCADLLAAEAKKDESESPAEPEVTEDTETPPDAVPSPA